MVYTNFVFLVYTTRGGVYNFFVFSVFWYTPPWAVYTKSCVLGIHHLASGSAHIFCETPPPFGRRLGPVGGGRFDWGPGPKVDRHFDMEITTVLDSNKAAIVEAQNLRHRLWRKRGRGGSSQSWRPRKRYRLASAEFLRCLDRQILLGTSLNGLSAFRPSACHPWASWETQPHLTIVSDQGSDCVSGLCAALFHPDLALNLSVYWDPSHGAHRDVLKMWRDTNQYSYLLMALLAINLAHGPEDTDMRYTQVKSAMSSCFELHTSTSCELFQGLLPELAATLLPDIDVPEGCTPEQAIWAWLRNWSYFQKKGYRVNLCRFLSFPKACRDFKKLWWASCFQAEYAALELDMLGSSSLRKKAQLSRPDSAAQPTTSASAVAADQRVLRSCCQNALVLAVNFLTDGANYRTLVLGTAVAEPVLNWHIRQNQKNRSAQECSEWLQEQLNGGYMEHVQKVVEVLENRDCLQEAGLLNISVATSGQALEAQCAADDEAAALFGQFAWTLAGARQMRALWMLRAWPVSLGRMLLSASEAASVIGLFKKDWLAFCALRDLQDRTKEQQSVLERSVFQLHAVRQIVTALSETGWVATPPLLAVIRSRTLASLSTQAVEDANNIQKNERASLKKAATPRFRTPQSCMASLLKSKLVDKIHHYSKVPSDRPLSNRSLVLVKENFVPELKHETMPFG